MGEELEEKINLNEIKKLNEWDIIETYFRDNPNYKSQHQIDSFNEFIYSKTNGIEYIIKRENPQIIYKEATGDDNYRYQINLFYGETLNDDGSIRIITDSNFLIISLSYEEELNLSISRVHHRRAFFLLKTVPFHQPILRLEYFALLNVC